MGRMVGRLFVGVLKGAWAVFTGICQALGMVLTVMCAVIEAMAMIFLLGSLGGKR